MNKRWYDNDPIVKKTVELLEQSDNAVRDRASDYIIEKSNNSGYVLTISNYEYFWQRWQDNNVKHFLAMEYLKLVDDETRGEICTDIVNFIEGLKQQA